MTISRADNNTEKPKEKHVRIIYVSVATVLGEMHRPALGDGPVGTATLAQVAKHIGAAAPTDIVVFAKQPWHYAGRGSDTQLRAHPQVHHDFPETILVIKPDEEAVWTSDRSFQITGVRPSADPSHSSAAFPEATGTFPDWAFTNDPISCREETPGRWVARSGVPKVGAHKHMYKIRFTIENDDIDPDVYCGGSN
jgi:hypothetical protein